MEEVATAGSTGTFTRRWPGRTSALDRAGDTSMGIDDPLAEETDADAWYRERRLNGPFDEVPVGTVEVKVDVPEEVEKFVRKRHQDLKERDRDSRFIDALMDHMNIQPKFVLQEPAPEDDDWIIVEDDDEQ